MLSLTGPCKNAKTGLETSCDSILEFMRIVLPQFKIVNYVMAELALECQGQNHSTKHLIEIRDVQRVHWGWSGVV